jgi:hypothetical protein
MVPNNSITEIKDYFSRHDGLQLANRFRVSFSGLPANLRLNDGSNTSFVQAEYMAIGPRSINTVQDNLTGYGNGRFVPKSQDLLSGGFGVQLIFPVTNDQHLIKFFNDWFNTFYKGPRNTGAVGSNGSGAVPSFLNSYIVPYYDSIVKNATMDVEMLDPNGNVNSTMFFYEVFPVETQPVEMSMAFTDKYVRYAVTFAYREYVHQITAATP